ncbi:Cobalamin biosynthetic protein (anaerobic pathway of cobalamin biosynthesis, cobD) [Hyphomicrobium sp. GJ21]|uniref:adenosylcobinamide-phosphate synthase CbiB n=1 Tax=Hyphomicrobium sp. GJ21 TaxID=113574 RepID=UPI000622BAC8|nr:adenosylcobinamide-phosphate synthase CbiB [Hyphomicrobium sp. GJ21]CEJ88201.1 Cobalamin biosynthetic protein (anaerobic pathway of cobalamin biosynthesis, cobD) [Hyphomicrobium sp. GJ21]
MSLATTLIILVAALGVEALFGYPQRLYKLIGHPVTWIGALISKLDRDLNRDDESRAARKASGVLALIVLVAIPAGLAWIVQITLASTWLGNIALVLIASTMLASRSLYDHVRDVAQALRNEGLDAGRTMVGRIVGRNPETLDEHGVARAAIESLAENASDGITAPVVWFALLGLPGLAAYKAINTADSMIGHRTPRHDAFGWAAARLDDLVNLPASRLTGFLFALAARFIPNGSMDNAFRAMRRDAHRHRSPNAGWPESAMAGALGLKLNGPKTYGATHVDDAYMGDGRREATADDIDRALRLAVVAWGLMIAGLSAIVLILQA